jgi:TolB-like protein
VYSLGVVIFEMVTGALPFEANTPMAAAVKRLREAPPSPRTLAPNLDTSWESVILHCLERDASRRIADASQVARALSSRPQAAAFAMMSTEIKPPLRRARLFWPVLALLLVAAGVGVVAWKVSRPRSVATAAAASIKPRRSVAVVGFRNLSGRPEAAWLSSALGEMLSTEIASGEQLRAVGGAQIARGKLELALGDSDSLSAETLQRVRADLGADVVVLGSYVSLGERIRIDLRVQEATSGQTLATFSEAGAETGLFEMVSRAGAELRRRLGVGSLSPAAEASVRATMPSKPEAARAYAEGLALHRSFDFAGAEKRLSAAAAAEPEFPLAHSALAAVLFDLGYHERARVSAQRALEHAADLSRQDRLLIEARSEELAHHLGKAASLYGALHEFFPDDVDRGLDLARTLVRAERSKDALATLDELRKLPSPLGDDPRIDLAEAEACRELDPKRALAAAKRAAQKADDRQARLLAAEAHRAEGVALDAQGESKAALPLLEDARRVHESVGNRLGVAVDLLDIGTARHRVGDLRGQREVTDQALKIFRDMGDRAREGWALGNLGTTYYNDGDYDTAQKMWQQAAAIAREVDNRGDELAIKSNLGVLADERGDLDAAQALYEEVRSGARELGMRETLAIATLNLGETLLRKGDLAGARRAFEWSLPIRRELGDREGEAIDLVAGARAALEAGDVASAERAANDAQELARQRSLSAPLATALLVLGDVSRERDEAAQAKSQLEESAKLMDAIPDRRGAAEARLGLLQLLLDGGNAQAANQQAEKLAAEMHALHAGDGEARAEALHAQALLALGKPPDARKAVAKARELVAKSPNASVELFIESVAAGCAKPGDDAAQLDRAIARAGKLGFRRRQLELRRAKAARK